MFLLFSSPINSIAGNGNSGNGNAEFTQITSPQDLCPDGTLDTTGTNKFFNLTPGFQLTFSGEENKEELNLVITVLDETETVDGIPTRVVEECEKEDGGLAEVSRNYFVICSTNKNVFYYWRGC